MTVQNESELSYLAAAIPEGLEQCKHAGVEDVYFPASQPHPKTRVRCIHDTYEFTKKIQSGSGDAGEQQEQNIELTAEEYQALVKGDGRSVSKVRYFMPYEGRTAEVDIFRGPLEGLVIVEFEFATPEQKKDFVMPSFCLADVTQENFIAGGVLAGKSYADIAEDLARYNYQPLHLDATT